MREVNENSRIHNYIYTSKYINREKEKKETKKKRTGEEKNKIK